MKIIDKDESGKETTLYPVDESPPAVAAVFQEIVDNAGEPACTVPATSGPPKKKQRPHLDVLIDRLRRRVAPVVSVLDEISELADVDGFDISRVTVSARMVRDFAEPLLQAMECARDAGCTGKVTAKSRALARLRPGTRVRYVDTGCSDLFSERVAESVNNLRVDHVAGDYVWLAVDGAFAGRALWSEVVTVDEDAGKC